LTGTVEKPIAYICSSSLPLVSLIKSATKKIEIAAAIV
jgi:hypothetical protein